MLYAGGTSARASFSRGSLTLFHFRYVLRAYIQFHFGAKNPGTPAVASDDALRHYGLALGCTATSRVSAPAAAAQAVSEAVRLFSSTVASPEVIHAQVALSRLPSARAV